MFAPASRGNTCGGRTMLLALVLCLCALSAMAQNITSTGALSFGSFVAGSGGTVIVAASGARTKSGGVVLVAQGAAASAAQFSVSGTPGATYGLTLPANNTVTLSDGNGHTMAINAFVSSPAGTGQLSVGGTASPSVGATLTVANAQAPGNYSGFFSVTVNYP